jgi:hypothetical protein
MASEARWFFVYCLRSTDQQFAAGNRYEVQVLDDAGRAAQVGYFVDPQLPLVIDGQTIPLAVLKAALRQPSGKGDYVNDLGERIPAF